MCCPGKHRRREGARHVQEIKRYEGAAVHISSTLTPLNKAVDTAIARVECARIPVGRALSREWPFPMLTIKQVLEHLSSLGFIIK